MHRSPHTAVFHVILVFENLSQKVRKLTGIRSLKGQGRAAVTALFFLVQKKTEIYSSISLRKP